MTAYPCWRRLIALALPLAACDVSPTAQATGGVGDLTPAGSCARGTVVVLGDYLSTQIAIASLDGTPLSASFLSTASSETDGLAWALSGDVVVPTSRPASGRVVLLDRYGTNVVTWADPASGEVIAQLPVGTGFESNPQDYVEIDAERAYLTRWGINGAPGAEPFDTGSDVLLIDTREPRIVASIPMPSQEGFPPRPAGIALVDGTAIIVLQRLAEDFTTQGDTQLLGVRDGVSEWSSTLDGLKGCGRPALSPSGRVLGLSCAGGLAPDGSVVDPARAAIVTLDLSSLPPTELQRWPIADQLGDPPQDQLAFASETLIIGKTQTALGGDRDNQSFVLDRSTGEAAALLRAGKDAHGEGKGLVYGAVRCAPDCGDVCLLADADLGVLQRWRVNEGRLTALDPIKVETQVGLPPIGLGAY